MQADNRMVIRDDKKDDAVAAPRARRVTKAVTGEVLKYVTMSGIERILVDEILPQRIRRRRGGNNNNPVATIQMFEHEVARNGSRSILYFTRGQNARFASIDDISDILGSLRDENKNLMHKVMCFVRGFY